jgi:hypothetical protein
MSIGLKENRDQVAVNIVDEVMHRLREFPLLNDAIEATPVNIKASIDRDLHRIVQSHIDTDRRLIGWRG